MEVALREEGLESETPSLSLGLHHPADRRLPLRFNVQILACDDFGIALPMQAIL